LSALELKIPPVIFTLLLAGLMWLAARLLPEFLPVPGPTTGWRLAAALALCFAGLVIGIAGVMAFRRSRTTVNPLQPEKASALVAEGIFRRTRNPMYLGLLLALLGWAVYLGNLLSLLLALAFVPWMNRFQIGPEERSLEHAFGAEFTNYRRRVRRWL